MPVTVSYAARHPEESLLYRVVAENLESFLAAQQARARAVPAFVEEEFRSFLECGQLEFGFLRLRCESCGKSRLLPFACKGRGYCPSCCGRRMAETAAHLVDRVIPAVPVRQWVLSLPYSLRFRVAFDADLLTEVLAIFVREVFGSLRRRAREYGIPNGKCGSVTFVQRFGSALNLTPHFHLIALNGVYAAEDGEAPVFYALRPPDTGDVVDVAQRVAVRVAALLEKQDRDAEPEEPALAALYGASLLGTQAMGPRAGRRVQTAGEFRFTSSGSDEKSEESFEHRSPRCALVSGFSVHAGVGIRADDRKGLELLLRYAARPPVAVDRLAQLADGRLSYRLKTPWKNGTTHVIFDPLDFLSRLAVLVPFPRINLVRFHGIFGPAAAWRAAIVPAVPESDPASDACECDASDDNRKRHPNYSWSTLMRRVFEFDVLNCSDCGGRLRILAAIHPPINTRKILECMGLPSRAPPVAPAVSDSTFDE